MYDFAYRRPASLAEASAAIAADSEATVIAGGQTLLPVLRARLAMPSALIDLGRLPELKGVKAQGDRIVIGAGERHADVATNALVREALPGVATLAGGIGDPQVRHRGTIGGSIANNDPSACYPSSALALDATIITTDRAIAAGDFFTGMYATALRQGELVTAVSYPRAPRCAYVKFPNPASRFALIGIFAAVVAGRTRIAVTGGGAGVFRWTAAEAHMDGGGSATAVANLDMDLALLTSDLHGSAEYRRQIARTVAVRALALLAQTR